MDIQEQSEAIIKQLEDNNKKAVKNKTLVGRYIAVSVADGYAYYRCIKETKNNVILEWVSGIDEYSDWNLGKEMSSMLKKKFRALTDLYASLIFMKPAQLLLDTVKEDFERNDAVEAKDCQKPGDWNDYKDKIDGY